MRRTVTSMHAERHLVGPAVDAPRARAGSAPRTCRAPASRRASSSASGSRSPDVSSSLSIVVDSPPGRTSASTPRELLGRADLDARRRRARRAPHVLAERPLQREHADLHDLEASRVTRSPAPLGELDVERVDLLAAHRLAEPARHLGDDRRRRGSAWWPRRSPWPSCGGSALLKMPLPTNTACAPSCITSAASAGVAMPPAQNSGTGQLAALGDLLHELDRRPQLLGPAVTARPRRPR